MNLINFNSAYYYKDNSLYFFVLINIKLMIIVNYLFLVFEP